MIFSSVWPGSMNNFDLIIRGGSLVTHTGVLFADVGILNGSIVEIRPEVPGASSETINAAGLHIFPGLNDSHVHFNQPGRTDWGGIETRSQSPSAGGGAAPFV